MYKRLFDIEKQLDEAMFLFGARQVGKSTLLQERFEDAVYYDLLLPNIRKSFKRNPELFKEALSSKPAGTLVIVDEIQKVPELLDLVHWLMVNKGLRFILSGSSARKLKKSGANTLGGRAQPRTLFPLVWPEVSDFQIDKAVQNGMIPRHYLTDDATDRLEAYVDVYIKEEILDEASVQDIDAFERFMEVAAISDGEMLNYSNIATDCVCLQKPLNHTIRFFMTPCWDMRFLRTEKSSNVKLFKLRSFIILMWDCPIILWAGIISSVEAMIMAMPSNIL